MKRWSTHSALLAGMDRERLLIRKPITAVISFSLFSSLSRSIGRPKSRGRDGEEAFINNGLNSKKFHSKNTSVPTA